MSSQQSTSKSRWRHLFAFTNTQQIPVLILVLFLAAVSGLAVPAFAFLLGLVFNTFSEYSSGRIGHVDFRAGVNRHIEYIVALAGLGLLFHGWFFASWLNWAELQAKIAQRGLYSQLLDKPLRWIDARAEGVPALTSRIQLWVHDLQYATSQPLGDFVQYLVTIFAALLLAFYTSWDLTLVTLSTLPVVVVFLAWSSARMQPYADGLETKSRAAEKIMTNAVVVIGAVTCYSGQNAESQRYKLALGEARTLHSSQASWVALQIGATRLLTLMMFVQGFWYGTRLVSLGQKTAGEVLTAFWACLMATQSAEQLITILESVEKGKFAGKMLTNIHTEPDEKQAGQYPHNIVPNFRNGDIVFSNLSFSYPSSRGALALSSLSLTFVHGRTTFLIGGSGSGKTTIANLLLRLYEPDQGTIRISHTDLTAIDKHRLRQNICLIEQDALPFADTLLNNIVLFDGQSSRSSRVANCIKISGLAKTISALPLGLQTKIREQSSLLSGGQCQRLLLARARYRDPTILILDEATCDLDIGSKIRIFSQIREWRRGKTTIIITHDLAQIKPDDLVYILEGGRVSRKGLWRNIERTSDISGLFQGLYGFAHKSPGSLEARTCSTTMQSAIRQEYLGTRPALEVERHRTRWWDSIGYYPQMKSPTNLRFSNVPIPRTPLPLTPSTAPDSPTDRAFDLAGPRSYELQRRRTRFHDDYQSQSEVEPPLATNIAVSSGGQGLPDGKDDATHTLNQILSTVWPSLERRQRVYLLGGLVCAMVHACALPLFALTFSKLLNNFLLPSDQNPTFALRAAMAILGVACLDAIASYLMHYLLELASRAWVDQLKLEAFRRILNQSTHWFDHPSNTLAGLATCLSTCAEDMCDILRRFVAHLIVAVCMTLIAITWSLALCWQLALVGIGAAVVLYCVSRLFEVVNLIWEDRALVARQASADMFSQTFLQLKTVKLMTLESIFSDRFRKVTQLALNVGRKKALATGFFFGLSEAASVLVTALIFWVGSALVESETASVTDIASVFTMLLISFANANAHIASIPRVSTSKTAASRLLRLVDLTKNETWDHLGHIRLHKLAGPLKFTQLDFCYPLRPHQKVLSSFSLTVHLGMSTGLVGPSGCGKSTVLSLILGLYSISPFTTEQIPELQEMQAESDDRRTENGTLAIGDMPYKACHLPSLRALIGYVPQQALVLPATIAENIAYGLNPRSQPASLRSVQKAAMLLGIHDFIQAFPEAYGTRIGDGGVGLSGGQMQLIGIARAIVRRPQMVIMDEPTSNLDAASSLRVQDAVKTLVGMGVTVLVATHSMEMMKAVDKLAVMEEGKIVEEGKWDSLIMRENGRLRHLLGIKERRR